LTNIGFHDVDYHSGEPFSPDDWPNSRAANAITWSTTPFSTNENANALRWATLYNFRFDANAPPTARSGTLGLFKPRTSSQASVSTIGPN